MKRKQYLFEDKLDQLLKAAMKAKGRTNESDYVRQAVISMAVDDIGVQEVKRIMA